MVIIAIGVYSEVDKNKVDELASKISHLRIMWDYETKGIDEEEGLAVLRNHFNLYKTGIIVHEDDVQQCHSYTLIDEITNYCMHGDPYPLLFGFVDNIDLKHFVLAFADEWDAKDTIRLESIQLKDVRKRLSSVYVWCEEYLNLQTNVLSFDDSHPLVLDVHN